MRSVGGSYSHRCSNFTLDAHLRVKVAVSAPDKHDDYK